MKRPLLAACTAVVLAAAVWLWLHPFVHVSYGEADGEEVYLTGRVYAKEFKSGYQSPILVIYIEPERLLLSQQNISYCDNFICTLQDAGRQPPMGSTATVRGTLAEYAPAGNPGQFDAGTYYATMGISAQIKDAELIGWEGEPERLKEGLWRLRCLLGAIMDEVFAKEDAAILKTMLLGDKASLDGETKSLYKEAGIMHILAISGLHITILGMGLYKFLRKLYIPLVPASVLCGIIMLLYGVMVGMPVSAMRAIGMFLLRLLAGCIGRTYDMLTALALCAAAMVLEQPLYLCSSGFLLSYLAVLAIGVLKPAIDLAGWSELRYGIAGIAVNTAAVTDDVRPSGADLTCGGRRRTVPARRKKSACLDSFFTSLSVTVFTLPVQLYFFYEVSVYSVFFNLLVLPLVGYVLACGLGVLAARLIWPAAAAVPAIVIHLILSSYMQGCEFMKRLPGSLWTPGKPENWQILCFFLLVAMVICLKKLEWKYKIGLLCGAVLLFGIRERTGLTVTFLDVGQGDCICLELPGGENWLVDGGSSSVRGVGTYRIRPFLKSRGINTLHAVFLSHPDSDHTNGVEELLADDSVEIGLLALPCSGKEGEGDEFGEILTLAGQRGIPVLWLQAGMEWESGGVRAACLHPGVDFSSSNTNAASEVMSLSYGPFSLLLTGDVEGDGEETLLDCLVEKQMGEFTMLKVAHHGSAYSTSEEFLESIAPVYAVISCGENNSYGHPHEETLKRLEEAGCKILRTDELGAIIFAISPSGEVEKEGYKCSVGLGRK